MDEGPVWFAPKRYGFGTGVPTSWQGWVVMIGYIASVISLSLLFRYRTAQLFASIIPLTVAFMVICAKTTRGGWRWRWGDKD